MFVIPIFFYISLIAVFFSIYKLKTSKDDTLRKKWLYKVAYI